MSQTWKFPTNNVLVEEDGTVLVTSAYEEAVLKVDPISDTVERIIEIPGRGVFDCTFGGPRLRVSPSLMLGPPMINK